MKRAALERFEYSAPTMGTMMRIVVYALDQAAAERVIHAGLDELERLIPILNNYSAESEISRLQSAFGSPQAIGHELHEVLVAATRWRALSDGAFDISLGTLFRLWSKARKQKRLPSDEELEAVRRTSGWDRWRLTPTEIPADALDARDPRASNASPSQIASVELFAEGLILDTSGLATGYILDRVFEAMERTGHAHVLIDIGGDIRVGAAPPDTRGWVVMVAGVSPSAPPLCRWFLESCAVTTSGDLNQFVEIGGRRYSHLMDPIAMQPLERRQCVSVVADTAIDADAGATALCVLGMERGSRLFDRMPLREAYLLEIAAAAPGHSSPGHSSPGHGLSGIRLRRLVHDESL